MIRHLILAVFAATSLAACGSDDSNNDFPPNAFNNGADMAFADSGEDVDMGSDSGEPSFEMPITEEALFEVGPYEVGYREVKYTYDPPGTGDELREISVKVWYPAAAESNAEAATYAVGGIVELQTESALDSPPIHENAPFPVAIYSHGSGGEGLLAYPYGEHMASWGWIVFAPNHAGNTAIDALTMRFDPFLQTALYRVTDITELMDAIESGLDESVDGASDMERVFLFGHSFGGYTTLAVAGADLNTNLLVDTCMNYGQDSCDFIADAEVEAAFRDGFGDARIDAIAPQAPALIPLMANGAIASINVPTMLQSGRLDVTLPDEVHAIPTWEALDGGSDIWVEMPLGAHYSFITICTDLQPSVLNAFRPDADMDGCGEMFIDTTVAVPTLGAYLHAFARRHVLGEGGWDAVLQGQPFDEGFELTSK